MKTKLFIVEGIPGSGKTTTAQFLRDQVEKSGENPMLYLENAHYHPVDIDNLAALNSRQYEQMLATFDVYQPYLTEIAEFRQNEVLLHYLRWFNLYDGDIPKDLIDALMEYDAHDTLSPDRYLDLLVERWATFAEEAQKTDEITILECSLLQNPITVFVGKHNYNIACVKLIVNEIADSVRDLQPVLIHLRGDSVRGTLQRVIESRPRQWLDAVIDYVTNQGYGKRHKLEGLEGVFCFYEMMQTLEDEITAQLDWRTLVVNNTDWDWERIHKQIGDFLQGC